MTATNVEMVAKREKYCAAQLAISIPSISWKFFVSTRDSSRKVTYRSHVAFFDIRSASLLLQKPRGIGWCCSKSGGSRWTSQKDRSLYLSNNGAVDKAIWQRLDIDGSVKSDEVELRDLGWNTFAKKHLLVTKGIDVRIAAEPQVTMNVVQYGHEKSDIMSPFGYVIHCRWFSLRVEMALDMKSW